MRAPLLLIGAASSSALVACVGAAPDPVGSDPTSSTATAIVVVERTAGPGDAVRGDAVIARFIRVRQGAVDDPALRIAGVAEDIPAPGACFAPSESTPIIQGRAVELLDVGQVVLAGDNSKSTVLLPRSMPDPAGVVSGVFYSSRTSDVFAPGSRVSLRSSGGADLLDGFSVSVTAPRDVGDVNVTSVASGLEVSWDATDAAEHDLVYVDILSPAPRVVMRCTSADDGNLLVPQSAIAGIDEGQLAVHRLHKESFKAKGIEPGEVRFDVARVVTFRR
ncbi:MAG: hypothetical protein KF764_13745 [Labilithrix sp.]|nr:hypothetical protein [Labilithrix sp.]MBX3225140.1 hypothetical protein [Labilithrix sp.]